jgi:hypothetical protein
MQRYDGPLTKLAGTQTLEFLCQAADVALIIILHPYIQCHVQVLFISDLPKFRISFISCTIFLSSNLNCLPRHMATLEGAFGIRYATK